MNQLQDRLDQLGMSADIDDLERLIASKVRDLAQCKDLGSSVSSCNALLTQIMALQNEAQVWLMIMT